MQSYGHRYAVLPIALRSVGRSTTGQGWLIVCTVLTEAVPDVYSLVKPLGGLHGMSTSTNYKQSIRTGISRNCNTVETQRWAIATDEISATIVTSSYQLAFQEGGPSNSILRALVQVFVLSL